MIHINEFLINSRINKKIDQHQYFPNSLSELESIIIELLSNKMYDLNCIDTSKITSMNHLFDVNVTTIINDIDINISS
ncbi:MAG: hypothetical protein J6D03_00010 [Clostridia bacterium]|nr:hypothetical protein [Clostridia bacterium]